MFRQQVRVRANVSSTVRSWSSDYSRRRTARMRVMAKARAVNPGQFQTEPLPGSDSIAIPFWDPRQGDLLPILSLRRVGEFLPSETFGGGDLVLRP
jgi:hypothetical protein